MLTTFIVYRKTWGRSALLTAEGSRCCLGHYCKQAGVPDEAMRARGHYDNRIGYPWELPEEERAKLPEVFRADPIYGQPYAPLAGQDNDPRAIATENDHDDRDEATLTAMFAAHGITVVFSDEDEPNPAEEVQ